MWGRRLPSFSEKKLLQRCKWEWGAQLLMGTQPRWVGESPAVAWFVCPDVKKQQNRGCRCSFNPLVSLELQVAGWHNPAPLVPLQDALWKTGGQRSKFCRAAPSSLLCLCRRGLVWRAA